MRRRKTIGENPLDAVVPDLATVTEAEQEAEPRKARPRTTVSGVSEMVLRAPLRVIDDEDRPVLTIDVGKTGPRLRLFDSSGNVTVLIGSHPDGGTVIVYNSGKEPSAVIHADSEGGNLIVRQPGGDLRSLIR